MRSPQTGPCVEAAHAIDPKAHSPAAEGMRLRAVFCCCAC